jgi:hypothetical protein
MVAYFGLNIGNSLTYRSKQSVDTTYIEERAEVGGYVDFHGVPALQNKWFDSGASAPYSIEFLNADAQHLCYFGERTPDGDTVFDPPICIPRYMAVGETFSVQTMVTEPAGVPSMRTFVWTVVANEPVTVPAGTFLDVLRIRAGWADEGGGDSSYAKGIGFVRGWGDGSADDWNSELTAYQLATWVPIQGNVRLADGTPICAMVLANGQYMFSCAGAGAYNLNVPLDENGQVTLFAFADGFSPFRVTDLPAGLPLTVRTETANPSSPFISMTRGVECSTNDWVRIYGVIESFGGDPLCAMVLANGQHMFSCGDSQGRYDLTVPADGNGTVTVFGFADGFQPYSETFVAPLCGGK